MTSFLACHRLIYQTYFLFCWLQTNPNEMWWSDKFSKNINSQAEHLYRVKWVNIIAAVWISFAAFLAAYSWETGAWMHSRKSQIRAVVRHRFWVGGLSRRGHISKSHAGYIFMACQESTTINQHKQEIKSLIVEMTTGKREPYDQGTYYCHNHWRVFYKFIFKFRIQNAKENNLPISKH